MPAPKGRGKGKPKGKGKPGSLSNQDAELREDRNFKGRKKRRRVCIFCADKVTIDYKNVEMIRRFMTDRGKIAPRRSSGCCAKHQRIVASAIKRARQIALVPFGID